VVDLDTGTIKTQIHYPVVDGPSIGRPYGLLHAIDIDNDGFRDVVMVSCQVEEYVGIVRNVGGKTLAPLWSQFVEQDYPTDNKELRPNITSVADIDGDGKRELVLGLYNVDGDSRWHTVAFSPDTGWKRRGVDLPGRFFHGCYDLDGDGTPELITTEETARRVAPRSTLVVVDGRTGKDRARLDNVSLVIADGHLGGEIGFLAYRATPVYVNGKQPGLLVRLNGEKTEKLLQLRGDRLTTVKPSWTADARMAAISRYPASTSGLDLRRGRKTSREEADALSVRVVRRDGSPELVVGLSDNSTVSGRPDWRKPGRLMDTVSQPGGTPSVWVGADQKPVVLTRSADRNTIYVGRRDKPIQEIRLPFPMYVMDPTSSGATLLPVGKERMQLFVGLQTGVHTLACALFDDSGNPLWRHDNFGPYPRSAAAIAPESGAGVRFFVNDH
ncbi:MAG: FG-GAP repeat domain-containing protein, partial [Armatimonadaceae bacterium]